MEYRVEQLADLANVRVDTIRFYQGKRLIPPPERRGRAAIYGDHHLVRLRRIRALLDEGFRLAQIARLLDREGRPLASHRDPGSGDLLTALVEESVGGRTLTRAELASEVGVPEPLIAAVASAGLMEPVLVDGEQRFTEADLEMAGAALGILGQGFPLDVLLNLAVHHANHVREVADRGIDLFDDHVRKRPNADPDEIADAFRRLLPHVTRLVALHFQRTLVNRALDRLQVSGEGDALQQALAATESLRLEVSWR
jgi:DNA-binding transcriptional MerR regulator